MVGRSYGESSLLQVAPNWKMVTNSVIYKKKRCLKNYSIEFENEFWIYLGKAVRVPKTEKKMARPRFWETCMMADLYNPYLKFIQRYRGFVYIIQITTLHQNSQSLWKAKCILNIWFLKINEGFYLKLEISLTLCTIMMLNFGDTYNWSWIIYSENFTQVQNKKNVNIIFPLELFIWNVVPKSHLTVLEEKKF